MSGVDQRREGPKLAGGCRRCRVHLAALGALAILLVGCTRGPNPFGYPQPYPPGAGFPQGTAGQAAATPPPATGPASVYAQQTTNPQLVELQQRVRQLDENNRELTTQVAQAQQQAQAFRERSDLLARQLQDATEQNRQLLAATQQYANQSQGMQASLSQLQQSMQMRGGARLKANNSVGIGAGGPQIAGARIIQEGSAVRIRIPADQLFTPGTAQLNPSATSVLAQVADTLTRRYPRQRAAIEGHTDSSQAGVGYPSVYQLAGAQAQAVMDYLVRSGGVPSQQLFVIAQGPNQPVADNQTPAGRAENRRVDIVVYPSTY